jgi:hypothetical protein
MAYSHANSKGVTYYLHSKKVVLKGGREQTIYYFAKAVNSETALNALPEGYVVKESARTGLPILAKAK